MNLILNLLGTSLIEIYLLQIRYYPVCKVGLWRNKSCHNHFHDIEDMHKMKDSFVLKNKNKTNSCISLDESLLINYPTMDKTK